MNNDLNRSANGNSPVRFAFLTGGQFDSLLAQLAATKASLPPVTEHLPVIAADNDASESAKPTYLDKSRTQQQSNDHKIDNRYPEVAHA